MRIAIPLSDAFSQYLLEVRMPTGAQTVTVDDSHAVVEIVLPAGVHEDEVEIVGCPLDRRGRPAAGCGEVVLKARVKRPEPKAEPKAAPKAEPVAEKAAPKAEPVAEKVEPKAEPVAEKAEPKAEPVAEKAEPKAESKQKTKKAERKPEQSQAAAPAAKNESYES